MNRTKVKSAVSILGDVDVDHQTLEVKVTSIQKVFYVSDIFENTGSNPLTATAIPLKLSFQKSMPWLQD